MGGTDTTESGKKVVNKYVRLYRADCLSMLKKMPDNYVDAIVTDPPYGLGSEPDAMEMLSDWIESGHHDVKSKRGFMGKEWDNFVPQPALWKEALRVLKPGGHILCFAGTRTYDLMVLGLRIAGFEIRDCIMWVYGSGFPKSRDISKDMTGGISNGRKRKDNLTKKTVDSKKWAGWGTALKPAIEPIVVARKPISEKTVAANVLKWGTGAVNIDGCRISTKECLNGGAYSSNRKTKSSNWGTVNNSTGKDYTPPIGRFPANLIHDGSYYVLAGFPDSNRYRKRTGVSKGYEGLRGGPAFKIKYSKLHDFGDAGSAARFFYCAKANKKDREEGLDKSYILSDDCPDSIKLKIIKYLKQVDRG